MNLKLPKSLVEVTLGRENSIANAKLNDYVYGNIKIQNRPLCYNLPKLKMKLEMAQRLENRDKRQTRRDPAEIGSNVDVALLTCTFVDTPGASEDTVEADIGSWGEAYTYKENYLTIQIQIQIREP